MIRDVIARRRQSERGAAMVEFALILPIVMSLVLGLVTGGALYNKKLAMSSASREGSRFGATLDGPTLTGWALDVQKRTQELVASDLELRNVCVSLVKVGTGDIYILRGADCATDALMAAPGNPSTAATGDCLVKVWIRKPNQKLQAMFFTTTVALTTSSVSRYEGTVSGSCS